MMNELWALESGHYKSMRAFWENGGKIDARLEALVAAVKPQDLRGEAGGTIAVIPVHGIIEQRQSLFGAMFGGTSIGRVTAMGRQAMNDPSVRALVLDFSTPGGSVLGGSDLHAEIMSWRSTKPIVGQVDSVACSLGNWLISACHEIVATQDSLMGALGIITTRVDFSKANEAAGIKEEYLTAGEHKDQSSSDAPLTDVGRASIQASLDYVYSLMLRDVSAGMGVSVDTVKSTYGKGLVMSVPQAKAAGMFHRQGTLEDTLRRLSTPQGRSAVTRAEGMEPELVAEVQPVEDGEAERRVRAMAIL